ncbi:hypothetical protein AVEN_33067-1 [Araneus ventricosus]|uniref:Uncharacterized protein n=1 Tax=Araneus ventricosus TaxID=182803 RepID=A0A4Y2PZY7_ARAVE|nr:hypothetical protein AVEN_33067-1 [Araneus ventricosus]
MRCQIRNWSCQTKAVSRYDIAIPVWGGSVKRRDIRTRVWLWWNWSGKNRPSPKMRFVVAKNMEALLLKKLFHSNFIVKNFCFLPSASVLVSDIQIPPLRDYPPSIRDRVGGERGGDGPPPGGERRGVINEKWPSLEVCQEATCTRPSSSGRGHRGKERPGIDALSSKRTSSLESSAPLHRHAILIKPQIEDLKTAVSQAETCAG